MSPLITHLAAYGLGMDITGFIAAYVLLVRHENRRMEESAKLRKSCEVMR